MLYVTPFLSLLSLHTALGAWQGFLLQGLSTCGSPGKQSSPATAIQNQFKYHLCRVISHTALYLRSGACCALPLSSRLCLQKEADTEPEEGGSKVYVGISVG